MLGSRAPGHEIQSSSAWFIAVLKGAQLASLESWFYVQVPRRKSLCPVGSKDPYMPFDWIVDEKYRN